jgi:hypothetical protein
MLEGYYAEHVVRNRERERARAQAVNSLMRVEVSEAERVVLSTGWSGWSWQRTGSVLGTVGMALAASLALPLSLQGLAWGLREALLLLTSR